MWLILLNSKYITLQNSSVENYVVWSVNFYRKQLVINGRCISCLNQELSLSFIRNYIFKWVGQMVCGDLNNRKHPLAPGPSLTYLIQFLPYCKLFALCIEQKVCVGCCLTAILPLHMGIAMASLKSRYAYNVT